MKIKKSASLLLLSLLLSSCKSSVLKAEVSDYVTSINLFENQDEVKILQLTDLHWSFATNFDREKNYLTKLVEITDPDIIMTTGDNILSGTTKTVDKLLETLNSFKNSKGRDVYFGITFGNHDRQGVYDKDYFDNKAISYTSQTSYFVSNNYKYHGLYRHPNNSQIFGRSNYAVNLTDGNDVIWQLYALDSGSDYFNGKTYDYDVIHEDQINWFKEVSNNYKKEDKAVNSLAFFHIPLYETAFAYDNANRPNNKTIVAGDFGGELKEPSSNIVGLKEYNLVSDQVYVGYKNTHFFDAAKEGNVKGMFYGHDHLNDFWALYDDKSYFDTSTNSVVNPNGTDDDILLAYGVKTGDGLSCDSNKIGGNLITIHKDGSFNGREGSNDFKHVYLKY